jgi:uncharacterized RDD family membrane protein YckC
MHCFYCRTWNEEEEHRCRRCGRRLHVSHPQAAPENYPVNPDATAPAPAPDMVPMRPMLSDRPGTPPQGTLFGDREAPKVIPFRPAVRELPEAPPDVRPHAGKPGQRRAEGPELPLLDFLPPAPRTPRTLKTSVEAVIYCDAPVATPMHRSVAAGLDLAMILSGVGLFLLTFVLCGGAFDFSKTGTILFGVSLALIAIFYGLLWAAANGDTAGMRWMRLRLVNFDGFRPDSSERWQRFGGACLSYAAVGFGLLWALLDEESLTWQDHISKTFPTLEESQASSFRRR